MKKLIILFLILGLAVVAFIVFYSGPRAQTRLNSFYGLTLQDPLFYSSFFDKEAFQKAIEGLKTSEKNLKKSLVENIGENTTVIGGMDKNLYVKTLNENDIFPYQLLEDLISINEKTNEFLNNPSRKLGLKLLDNYADAADSYVQYASSQIKVLDTYKTDNTAPPMYLSFVGSVSSVEIIKNDFLTIKENGDELKKEIEERKDCLSKSGGCQTLARTEENPSFSSLIESMKAEDFNLEGWKIDLVKETIPLMNVGQKNYTEGPYKIKSLCWQSPDSDQWMYLIYSDGDYGLAVMPKLAAQNYYKKITDDTPMRTEQILGKNGLKYYSQMEGMSYQCMDLTFYPQLLTINFLKKVLKTDQTDLEKLEEDRNYDLLMENQFSLIPPAINTISANLETLKLYITIQDQKDIPLITIFPARTAYSIFSFPFAKSIWRINDQLQYLVPEEKIPLAGSLIVNLDDLKKLGYTKTEIKNLHIDVRDLLDDLLKTQ